MNTPRKKPAIGTALFLLVIGGLALYFTFAAIQGDYGVFRRVQAEAEREALTAERDRLKAEAEKMANLTRRLSDTYLDLDLLDERARNVLGMIRSDEIVIH